MNESEVNRQRTIQCFMRVTYHWGVLSDRYVHIWWHAFLIMVCNYLVDVVILNIKSKSSLIWVIYSTSKWEERAYRNVLIYSNIHFSLPFFVFMVINVGLIFCFAFMNWLLGNYMASVILGLAILFWWWLLNYIGSWFISGWNRID